MPKDKTADLTLRMTRETMLLLMTAATIAAETCTPGSRERAQYDRVSREMEKAIDNG